MRTTCLLALLCLWLLALASASPKRLEKKSIANSLAPKAIEPVEQKLDAPSPKISDEALMESPGETVDRAKKQTTTFCVEVRQNKPTYVDCNGAYAGANAGADSQVFVVPGGNDLPSQEPLGPNGGAPGPTEPLQPGPGLFGPHGMHLPHHGPHGLLGPYGPQHGLHFSGPGTGPADGVPATIHYLFPGSDGSGLGPHGLGPHELGPHGLGPHGLGPHGLGPHGLGPHGLGPHELGPHGLGPHGLGPHGLGPHGLGPNLFGLNGGSPFGFPGMGGTPNDGGLNGILYQLPGGFPGDSSPHGVGPSGVHVHVHPGSGFPSGPDGPSGPGGSSPSGVHLHLPGGGSGGPPNGGFSSSPVHLSGIECLCAGTPAVGRDGEGNDGTPSNEALAVKFLQDLQKNDKSEGDGSKAATGEQSPSDQASGAPSITIPKASGLPLTFPMMIGGLPILRTSFSPYGWPPGLNGVDSPTTSGLYNLMRAMGIPTKGSSNAPSTGEEPADGGSTPTMRYGTPYGSPYSNGYGLPLMGLNAPLMRGAGGMPLMGLLPMMRAAAGVPMMAGMPLMRAVGGSPTNPQSSNSPVPIMIQMPSAKPGEDTKNPSSPNGLHLSIVPAGSAGDNPTTPNGQPLTMISMPAGQAGDNKPTPTSPNGSPLTIISMPMGKSADNAPKPTSPNGSPLTIISVPMGGRVGESPMAQNLPNGIPIQLLGGNPLSTDGKLDPSIILRHQPLRPMQYPMQYPLQRPGYGSPLNGPLYQLPAGYMGPYSPHAFQPHRSQYDCLQDSFQSAPAVQGLRFSRGPDESDLPAGGPQADGEANPEGAVGSEHAEPARNDDKESRISHFIDDEHNDAANNV